MALRAGMTSYVTLLVALLLLSASPSLAYDNETASGVNCSAFKTCGDCVTHLECGFCVRDNSCVNGGWGGPFKHPSLCPSDKWEYQYGQCFVTHKQVMISLSSALAGVILLSCILCVCCCLCQCCRRSRDDEERPLLGETLATRHFRRASFYNYNRNRPFDRRSRTLSNGTMNGSLGPYGRSGWRNDDCTYGYGSPSMMWVGDNGSPPGAVDYPIGSTTNSVGTNEWRSWEKKREELLAKYGKNNEG